MHIYIYFALEADESICFKNRTIQEILLEI